MKNQFKLAFIFISLVCLVSHNVFGELSTPFHNLVLISLIFQLLITMYSQQKIHELIKQKSFVLQVIFLIILLFFPRYSISIRLLILAMVALSSGWVLKELKSENSVLLAALGLTTFLVLSINWLFYNEPIIWTASQKFGQVSTIFLGELTGQPVKLNITASGLSVSVAFIIFGVILIYFSTKPKILRFIVYAMAVIMINALFIVFLHALTNCVQTAINDIPLNPMNFGFVVMLFDGIALWWFMRDINLRELEFSLLPQKPILLIFSISVILIYAVIDNFPLVNNHTNKKEVLIFNQGFLNWERPVFGKYGINSSGMFGVFPEYLKIMGYNVKIDSVFSKKNLHGTSTVVIINLDKYIPKEEKKILREFVYNGGSLMVMGDHTGLGGIMNPLNDLLSFVKIRFNFDCAHYLKKNWRDAFYYQSHPIWESVNDELDVGISVGASLNISPEGAKPLLFAKYGYSDNGDSVNSQNAYLGDRIYNAGELLGDIILVAEGAYGNGKVIVLGDTSPFQNGSLCYSFQFVNNLFGYLGASGSFWNSSLLYRIIFLLLALVSVVVLFRLRQFDKPCTLLWIVATILIINLLLSFKSWTRTSEIKYNKQLAYIDAAHLNRFSQYGEDGIWSLTYQLMRNHYLPVVQRKFSPDLLESSSVAFFIAPASEISKNELQRIDNYVRKGGTAVWSFGYEEKEPVSNLMKFYGFSVDNIPLGPIPSDQTNVKVEFNKAWPILIQNSIKTDILCKGWDYPVIVSQRVGRGRIIIVADPNFFLSENWELNNKYKKGNQLFLKIISGNNEVSSTNINSPISDCKTKLSGIE